MSRTIFSSSVSSESILSGSRQSKLALPDARRRGAAVARAARARVEPLALAALERTSDDTQCFMRRRGVRREKGPAGIEAAAEWGQRMDREQSGKSVSADQERLSTVHRIDAESAGWSAADDGAVECRGAA